MSLSRGVTCIVGGRDLPLEWCAVCPAEAAAATAVSWARCSIADAASCALTASDDSWASRTGVAVRGTPATEVSSDACKMIGEQPLRLEIEAVPSQTSKLPEIIVVDAEIDSGDPPLIVLVVNVVK